MTSLALGTVNKIITSKAGYKITGARAGIGVCLTSGATLRAFARACWGWFRERKSEGLAGSKGGLRIHMHLFVVFVRMHRGNNTHYKMTHKYAQNKQRRSQVLCKKDKNKRIAK